MKIKKKFAKKPLRGRKALLIGARTAKMEGPVSDHPEGRIHAQKKSETEDRT